MDEFAKQKANMHLVRLEHFYNIYKGHLHKIFSRGKQRKVPC